MIRLTDLAGNGSFTMGGKKFEYGKVYSNPYATAFKKVNEGEESQDHEVHMAQSSLDSIIKNATELKKKIGENEKDIPAWIQDHITNSDNYIEQANSGYHEYGDSNEVKFDDIKVLSKEEFQNEAGPCWKGYKQVGMKNKNGKEVPNCVPEGVVNEAKGRGFTGIQNDLGRVLDAIQSELEKYKSNKGTDKAKQNVENLKKLNVQKQKLEAELEDKVLSLYADYDLDMLSSFKRKR